MPRSPASAKKLASTKKLASAKNAQAPYILREHVTKLPTDEDVWAKLKPEGNDQNLEAIDLKLTRHFLGSSQDDNAMNKKLPHGCNIKDVHCVINKRNFLDKDGTHKVVVELTNTNSMTRINNRILKRQESVELNDHDLIAFPANEDQWYTYRIIFENLRARGKFIDIYDIIEDLGSGYFAEVKLAQRKDIRGPPVAVKIIDKHKLDGSNLREKHLSFLKSEILIMNRIHHPNLAHIYDLFDEPDYMYIVMEYIRDGELFDFITEKKRLNETETRKIFSQLFEAVKYLHDNNIVHRDLKPENILMPNKGNLEVKISDFGLSKLLGTGYSLMKTLCGTKTYVAPEILRSDRNYNKAVDMWSLGVIMFICLAGVQPFHESYGPPKMIEQIRQGRVVWTSVWHSISHDAQNLVRGLLCVDIDKRLTADLALKSVFMQYNPVYRSPVVIQSLPSLEPQVVPEASSQIALERVNYGPPSENYLSFVANKLSLLPQEEENNDSFVTLTEESIYTTALEFNSTSDHKSVLN